VKGVAQSAPPSVTVIVCAYTLRRWDALKEGIDSIAHQTQPPIETILVIDHNPELLERARAAFPQVQVIASVDGRGISSSRNTGIEAADGEILAFLDDDAIADKNWLEELTRAYGDPEVIGTGGVPRPRWEEGSAPSWLPVEFYWTVGCGYRGLPEDVAPVRNPIGATMSFRRLAFDRIGGFSTALGPNMETPNPHGGGEETDFAIRALRALPGRKVMHVPSAGVEHVVPAARTRWSYFRTRCWLEGEAKALLTKRVGATDGLTSERAYTLEILPTGVLHGLRDSLRGDLSGLQRAGAILAGLAITAAGYLKARLTLAR
jgi:glucosyl-dolichyl phosphate glucuronosyltransferase